jgi:hypothetical protein
MNSNKYSTISDSLIKVGVAIMLIIAASIKQQYSFYTLLRWTVMSSCIYFLFLAAKEKQHGLIVLYATIAIVFNPFKIIWFQKQTWHLIDYALSAIFILIAFYNLRKSLSNK